MTTTLNLDSTAYEATVASSGTHLVRAGGIAAAGAAAAVTTTAAIAHAAGMHFHIAGKPIPLAGFTQLTVVAVAIGAIIAGVLSRRAAQPRHTFVVTALALTAV